MVSRSKGNLQENLGSWQEFQDILHWVETLHLDIPVD